MLDLYVTVNINRTTKIQLRYCLFPQLLPRYCQSVAEPVQGVFHPIVKLAQCVIHRPLWMPYQWHDLLSGITLLPHQTDDHPPRIHCIQSSALSENLTLFYLRQPGHDFHDLGEIL